MAILSLILSSQPNILIIRRAPIADVSLVFELVRTFGDTVHPGIGCYHLLLLELGILFCQKTWKREGTDCGHHSNDGTPAKNSV